MAVADLIGATVGVILLVIVAYLLVGSTISTAEIVTNAQKSATMQEEMQMRTEFTIADETITSDPSVFNCTINNTGTEIISDFTHMDIIVYDNSSSNDYQLYPYNQNGGPGTWKIVNYGNDIIHPHELDPGESYIIQVTTSGSSPYWFQITTGNGVYASAFL
jgi:flagellar protein FlaF